MPRSLLSIILYGTQTRTTGPLRSRTACTRQNVATRDAKRGVAVVVFQNYRKKTLPGSRHRYSILIRTVPRMKTLSLSAGGELGPTTFFPEDSPRLCDDPFAPPANPRPPERGDREAIALSHGLTLNVQTPSVAVIPSPTLLRFPLHCRLTTVEEIAISAASEGPTATVRFARSATLHDNLTA